MRFINCGSMLLVAALVVIGPSNASQTGAQLQLDVKEFQLENGMLFLVVERR